MREDDVGDAAGGWRIRQQSSTPHRSISILYLIKNTKL
jgi:hypothetical protein